MFPYFGIAGYGLYGAMSVYGSSNLTESSPPQSFTENFSLSEIKAFLKIPERSPADPAEDALITSFIVAAREQGEIAQCRDLVRKQIDLSFDYWTSYRMELGAPLVSVDLVRYKDSDGSVTTLVEGTDYIVDTAKHPGLISPPWGMTWPQFTPWPSSAVLVRFTSGLSPTSVWWSDSGASVKAGMRLLISDWYHERLPFEKGAGALSDYPNALRVCLGAGAIPRVR